MHRDLLKKLNSTRVGTGPNTFFTWFIHSLTMMKSRGHTSYTLKFHLTAWHLRTETRPRPRHQLYGQLCLISGMILCSPHQLYWWAISTLTLTFQLWSIMTLFPTWQLLLQEWGCKREIKKWERSGQGDGRYNIDDEEDDEDGDGGKGEHVFGSLKNCLQRALDSCFSFFVNKQPYLLNLWEVGGIGESQPPCFLNAKAQLSWYHSQWCW